MPAHDGEVKWGVVELVERLCFGAGLEKDSDGRYVPAVGRDVKRGPPLVPIALVDHLFVDPMVDQPSHRREKSVLRRLENGEGAFLDEETLGDQILRDASSFRASSPAAGLSEDRGLAGERQDLLDQEERKPLLLLHMR